MTPHQKVIHTASVDIMDSLIGEKNRINIRKLMEKHWRNQE